MRYSVESGVNYYMYGGKTSDACGVITSHCVSKYGLYLNGTIKYPTITQYDYDAVTKSWYTGAVKYGAPTWSTALSASSFTIGMNLQYFTIPIYRNPNKDTVVGVASVSMNLAHRKMFILNVCLSVCFFVFDANLFS